MISEKEIRKMKEKETFISNMKYAFIAQIISLCLSLLMSLVMPKILGIEMYSYWQLFMFYTVYMNLFHFGISDGIYLRTGGRRYKDLDFRLLGAQFYLSLCWQIVIAIIMIWGGMGIVKDVERGFVIANTAIYMLIYNAISYVGMIFQAVNETKKYSLAIIVDKLLFLLMVTGFIMLGAENYKIYIVGYNFSAFVGCLLLLFWGRKIIFQKPLSIGIVIKEVGINISAGMPLMLAAFASNFIIGVARMVVDYVWGIEAFGKFSFSVSMTNFFLLFIRQVSMVMFPALRRQSGNSQKKLFFEIKSCMNLILPLILALYYPASWLLGIWLPQYKVSLGYLALLLPLVIFDGKTQMLFYTYMKVFREEKMMLGVNVVSVLLSFIFSITGACVFRDIMFIVRGIVGVTAFRSIFLEIFISKKYYHMIKWKEIILECLVVLVFMILSQVSKKEIAFGGYVFCYIIYIIMNKKNVSFLWKNLYKKRCS